MYVVRRQEVQSWPDGALPLTSVQDAHDRCRASFANGTERFLFDRRQTAFDVARTDGADIVSGAPIAGDSDSSENFGRHFRSLGLTDEHLFAAEQFIGL